MKSLCGALLVLSMAPTAWSGDLDIQVLITRKLSRKSVSPLVYDLRGVAPRTAPAAADPNEFERMVLYLEGGNSAPAPAETVTIEQQDSRFDPDIVIVPVGSTVQFPNSDPIFHNVFSLSRSQPFDLGYFPQGQSRAVKFNHTGVVQVYCHIHAAMYAAIVVTSSRWFGKAAADGRLSWSGVPAGHYRLIAWHKIAGLHAAAIDVPPTGKTAVTIRVPIDVEQGRP